MIRNSIKEQAQPFRYVILDLDDNTIDINDFCKTINQIGKENSFSITVAGCTETLTPETQHLCSANNVTVLSKPLDEDQLRKVLNKM